MKEGRGRDYPSALPMSAQISYFFYFHLTQSKASRLSVSPKRKGKRGRSIEGACDKRKSYVLEAKAKSMDSSMQTLLISRNTSLSEAIQKVWMERIIQFDVNDFFVSHLLDR